MRPLVYAKKLSQLSIAVLLTVSICLASVHESGPAHQREHASQSCPLCLVVHSWHTADVPPPVLIGPPHIVETARVHPAGSTNSSPRNLFFDAAAPRAPPALRPF